MKRPLRQRLYAGATLCCAPLWVLAAEPEAMTVYRSVGPDGVVMFSDAPNPSAVPIEVVPPPMPLKDEVERANQLFEQQLALLEILETSRHARAKEALEQEQIELDYVRTEAALQRARDREEEQTHSSYYPFFGPPYWGVPGRPGYPGRPGGPGRPEPPHGPPSKDRPPPPPPPPPPQHVQFPH
jgi:hypothetical protein